MEKILAEILAADKNILARRDDLIAALDEKVPGNLSRDYTPIKKAINLNVAEIFFVNDLDTAKAEAAEILKSSGMQEARINFVVDTFANAIVDAGKISSKKVESMGVAEYFQKAKVEAEKQAEQVAEPVQETQSVQNITPPQIIQPQQITNQVQPQNNFPTKTNKFLIGVIGVLAVALFVVIGNNFKTETELEIEKEPEVSELSLNGVELGMTESEVKKILGKPPMGNEGDIASTSYSYEYEHFYIDFSRDNSKVIYIWSEDPNFKTKRGIHVGSTYKELIDAYEIELVSSDPYSRWDVYGTNFETSDGREGRIYFGLRNDIIERINIFYS